MTYYYQVFFFIFGIMIGSFMNALVYRLPREIGVSLPRSFCPRCKKMIFWYENIPILSYIFLGGKCSKCASKIHWRYPLLELSIGFLALSLMPNSIHAHSLASFAFLFSIACVFIVHFFVDLEYKILPDQLNIYLALIFLAHSLIYSSWQHWLIGGLLGFFFPLAVTWIFYLLKGKIGLGGGDIKLYGALGLYLGPLGVMENIFLSCFLGSIIGILLILVNKIKRQDALPFGPFILIVAVLQIFFPAIMPKLF